MCNKKLLQRMQKKSSFKPTLTRRLQWSNMRRRESSLQKKKKLILQTQELQQRLKDLEQIIQGCEDDKEENTENEDPNGNEINVDNEPGQNGIVPNENDIANEPQSEPDDVEEDQ